MGNTHTRSNIIEKNSGLTASFTYLKGTVTGDITGNVTGNVTGNLTGNLVNSYVKLGNLYIITGKPDSFNNAGVSAVATSLIGTLAGIPKGSLFLNASDNMTATEGVYVKTAATTWGKVTDGTLTLG